MAEPAKEMVEAATNAVEYCIATIYRAYGWRREQFERIARAALAATLSQVQPTDVDVLNVNDGSPISEAQKRRYAPADRAEIVEQWFKVHHEYHEAVDAYNRRLELVEAERERENWTINAHQEYAALNTAQSEAFRASETLYWAIRCFSPEAGEKLCPDGRPCFGFCESDGYCPAATPLPTPARGWQGLVRELLDHIDDPSDWPILVKARAMLAASPILEAGKITTEQLDALQFSKVVHQRPAGKKEEGK